MFSINNRSCTARSKFRLIDHFKRFKTFQFCFYRMNSGPNMLVSVFRLCRLKIAANTDILSKCLFFQTVTRASPFLVQTTDAAKTESAATLASAFLATKASTVKSVKKWKMSKKTRRLRPFFNHRDHLLCVCSNSAALRERQRWLRTLLPHSSRQRSVLVCRRILPGIGRQVLQLQR